MFNTCWACINETVLLQKIFYIYIIKLCYIMYRRIIITSTLPFTSHCNYFRWTFKYFVFFVLVYHVFFIYIKILKQPHCSLLIEYKTQILVRGLRTQRDGHLRMLCWVKVPTSGWETDRGLTSCSLQTPRASLRNVKESNNNKHFNVT